MLAVLPSDDHYDPDRPLPSAQGAALLLAIAKGDQQAFETFYRGYQSCIFRFAYAQVQDSVTASDALIETMMRIWKSAAQHPAQLDVLAWVLRITYAVAQEFICGSESAARDLRASKLPPAHVNASDDASQRVRLRQGLESLASELRAAIHLALVENLPSPSIACVLDCDESAVHTSLREARASLRRQIEGATS